MTRIQSGFTLIELSIVLIIIGLLVGAIFVGQDLIKASAAQAQIAQIDKYNAAAATFDTKYGYLPGDIPNTPATRFGFQARGPYQGQGDGNGVIENNPDNGANRNWGAYFPFTGEEAMFWVDLSTAGMMDGKFSTATPTATLSGSITSSTNPSISSYFPTAKIGNGNYVYVWSGGAPSLNAAVVFDPSDGQNYFAVSRVISLNISDIDELPSVTVSQAYNIDKKIDDGLPQSGIVMAWSGYWWSGNGATGGDFDPSTSGPVVAGDGVATPPSSSTCYDNGNVAGATEHYSTSQQSGNGGNCWFSFKMQAQ